MEDEDTLYSGINEFGYRQYYSDEAKTQPICALTRKPYTNAGGGVLSMSIEDSE